MMRLLRDMLGAGLLAILPLSTPALAEDRGAMALALAAADTRDWVTARDAAQRSGPVAEALIGWQALRAGFGEFEDYLRFIRNHPDWPGLALLRERGDARLRPDLPTGQIREWFGDRLPDTLRAETAFLTTLDTDAARAERVRFWTSTPLEAAEETAFLTTYERELTPLLTARATAMLDQGEWRQAERLIDRLPQADRALLTARIALQARRTGVDDQILALPDAERDDPGLTMDRFRWRVQARFHDGARELMLAASTSEQALRVPDAWAQMRVDYARLAMRGGDWALAERLAAAHFLPTDNRHYSDLEWLAGFAALKQDAPDRALAHFEHLETVVGSAISTARALYWQGRAHEDLGDDTAAQAAFARAAQKPGVYYGQLAAEKVNATLPPSYAAPGKAVETLPDWRGAMRENSVFQAGLWLLATGRIDEAQRFFLHLAETAPPDDTARMARLMIEARAPWHGLRLSKRAADRGVIYPAAHFPLTGLEQAELDLPPELVLSIARQESEFNHTVSSHVGARGLMQLMPGTAEQMARQLGEPYQIARLTRDPAYNARLGAAYLQGLRDRFGTSTALTASGYNAGPGRPARWLRDFGDLRRDMDPVEWVELIPFDETRNYVMRVTEAMPVYRSRIQGKPAPIVPTWDLTGGGLMPPPVARLTLALSSRPPLKPFIGPVLPPDGVAPTSASAPDVQGPAADSETASTGETGG
ncbi:lytic transglycosylase domain-containing protein [Paracoccus sp. R12_1]|uniref:lytic transglycosylase domain-containing protein n=1 Tax=unclassified Paracoccus (in: a-proteobacteria) TaxID=2688777 RepID=UPI001ADC107E|nr:MULTISPECIES: lytic transglycosylase domain-containing protein [unclassified Paracoccus (in: a-proteobacteria)]MBO9455087.1 lytic transglycosylase domain-containing protein [Paracoccus sp. R12_2]MBO9486541.1 lytic transglycosylase domain-containing protein [Paracoccus sp. R12_1]